MANAQHDENSRPTIIALSSIDGVGIVPIVAIDSVNHTLSVDDGNTGSDAGNNDGVAKEDENGIATACVLSSAGDGTVINLYGNTLGRLLTQST